MRKSTKLLSMLLVVCMLVSLMPMGVLAAEPTGPKAASACTLGDPEAAYKLNIVNDAATLMLFEVTVNGQTETLTFGANETLSIGINEGDSFKVIKVGNGNYKVLSEAASFQSGEYENVITKEFTHKVGAGFKTGEKEIYVQRDGSYYEGDVETIGGNYAVKGSKIECPTRITSNGSSNAVLGVGLPLYRYRNVTIAARLHVFIGRNVPSSQPVMMPSSAPQ